MKQPDYTAAVEHLKASDPRLARLIEQVGPPTGHLRTELTIFYSLARSILYQQLAGAAASAILARVDALFPSGKMTPQEMLELPEEKLRAAGLSRNKLAALRDLAAKTLDGTVPTARACHRMTDEEIIEHCVQVKGIGRWTVEMLLLFRLGRPDVMPYDDYGIRKAMQLAYRMRELPKKKRMQQLDARWRPYRSLAAWYLWRSLELPGAREILLRERKKVAKKPHKQRR